MKPQVMNWADFYGDPKVRMMTPVARAVYLDMLGTAWLNKARLPKDESQIARLLGIPVDVFLPLWSYIKPCWRRRNGHLYNPRQQREWNATPSLITTTNRGSKSKPKTKARDKALKPNILKAKGKALVKFVSESAVEQTAKSKAALRHSNRAKVGSMVPIIFAHWRNVHHHPNTILDQKRRTRITARLIENGGNMGELLYAIDGAFRDDWLMGRDPKTNGVSWDGIETILRDRAQVERLAAYEVGYRNGTEHPLIEEWKRGQVSDED